MGQPACHCGTAAEEGTALKIAEALGQLVADESLIERLREHRKKKVCKVYRPVPATEFPELIVEIPSSWPHVVLAPLYDVHLGHSQHLDRLFARHLDWLVRTPYLITFDGGDLIDNSSKLSVGAGVYEQKEMPDNQIVSALRVAIRLWHKLVFKIPGNHEDRTTQVGIDLGRWVAAMMELPYFPDFCFCTIKFARNNFHLMAHHGVGAATTAGAQRMMARKAMPWARVDLMWLGHIHSSMADPVYQSDFDQKTGRMYERDGIIMVSPSYLGYFGTYAAKRMYPPGIPGLHSVTLQRDGRIDADIHARGRRL